MTGQAESRVPFTFIYELYINVLNRHRGSQPYSNLGLKLHPVKRP